MTFKKSIIAIISVLVINQISIWLGLYDVWVWIDIPMHFIGGIAIGMFALAIWLEGIHEVRFKGWLAKHLEWWLVPLFVLGFVSIVSIVWEWHEFVLDLIMTGELVRQPNIEDTMLDFLMGMLGGAFSMIFYKRK